MTQKNFKFSVVFFRLLLVSLPSFKCRSRFFVQSSATRSLPMNVAFCTLIRTTKNYSKSFPAIYRGKIAKSLVSEISPRHSFLRKNFRCVHMRSRDGPVTEDLSFCARGVDHRDENFPHMNTPAWVTGTKLF